MPVIDPWHFMKCVLFTVSAYIACCITATCTVLPSASIKEIFRMHSGLSEERMAQATFQDLRFEIGITKDAKIIQSPGRGMGVVKWGKDHKSFASINVFTQCIDGIYTEKMDVPIDIIKGVSTKDTSAALDAGEMRKSWKVGTIEGIGVFCVGELWGGFQRNVVTTGYFLDEEYGFCLQISTLKSSGLGAKNVEHIGRSMIAKLKALAKSEGLILNPFSKSGPLVVAGPKKPDQQGRGQLQKPAPKDPLKPEEN